MSISNSGQQVFVLIPCGPMPRSRDLGVLAPVDSCASSVTGSNAGHRRNWVFQVNLEDVASQRSEEGSMSQQQRRVLQGYRQEGKRFVPPFLQDRNVEEIPWMDNLVPELIWIALLNRMFGNTEGTALATSIAKAASSCDQSAKRGFATVSDYAALSDEQERCIRSALNAEGTLERALRGLAVLISHYSEFPLSFLADQDGLSEGSLSSTLSDLTEVIASIGDRLSHAATFAQATVVYICLINDQLKVSPGTSLANFTAIEAYPITEESQRVASSVRATVNFLVTTHASSGWSSSFWRQGRCLGPCEVV